MRAAIDALLPVLFAVAVHELGHIAVMYILGIKADSVHSRFWGIRINADLSRIGYAGELAVMLAGSGVDLLLAVMPGQSEKYAYACAAYGVFNLLPADFLDGGDVLRTALLWLGVSPKAVYGICRAATVTVTVLVWIAAVYLALRGFGTALLISSCYMMLTCFFARNS
ncbi:MAG: hypothetical protein IJ391_05835 [Clostridia bacterium]|nr:hypothetical protein [Clostridia bacterium]